ncbi:MAG: glycosyltransferase family 39 protein [Ignavibacteriae bacterium]|nr:glycosyltransferase family 39 protein [Ignavibacteriota bacterium]
MKYRSGKILSAIVHLRIFFYVHTLMKKLFDFITAQKYILLILGVGIAVRLWNINWSLPFIYEEAYPFRTAWNFWIWGKPGFDFNPHIFNYAALSFYVQFLIQVLHFAVGTIFGIYSNLEAFHQAFETDTTSFLIHARMASLVFDVGTMLVTYLFVMRNFRKPAAFLSAIFLAINPLHIKETHLVNVDTPLTFFVLLGVFCIFQVYHSPSRKWYLLSGLCIGLAMATKYTGAFLFAGLVFAHVLRSSSIKEAFISLKSSHLTFSGIIALAIFFLLNPYIILSFDEFFHRVSFIYYNVISYGHLGVVSSESSIAFYLFQSIPSHLGIPLTLTIVGTIFYLMWKREKQSFLLLFFPLIYLIVIAQWEYRADRYILPIVPLLTIIGTIGTITLWNQINAKIKGREDSNKKLAFVTPAILLVLVLVLSFPMALHSYEYQRSQSLPNTRTVAREWILKNIPSQSSVAMVPFGMELPPNKFIQINIPYHPVTPHALLPFYDARWFTDVDILICSSYDYDRYALEPEKYGAFLKFYSVIKSQCLLVHEIKPEQHQNGPTVWLYHPPQSTEELFDMNLVRGLGILAETTLVTTFLDRLAYSLFSKGKLQKSEQLMEHALMFDPLNLRLLKELTWTLFRLGKFERALSYSQLSLNIEPKQAEVIALEGGSLLRLNRFEEAEQRLLYALTINDKFEFPYLDLEMMYRKTRNISKQIDILKRYQSILPNESEATFLVQQRIEELQQSAQSSK